MDKRNYIGIALIFGIVLASSYFLQPSKNESKNMDSKKVSEVSKGSVNEAKQINAKTESDINESFYTLENENLKVVVSNKGGRIYSVTLKKFKNHLASPVTLFEGKDNSFGFTLPYATGRRVLTNELIFRVVDSSFVAQKDKPAVLKLVANGEFGHQIEYVYTLPSESLKVAYHVNFNNATNALATDKRQIELNWDTKLKQQEADIQYERQYSSLYYKLKEGDVDFLSETSDDKEEIAEGKTDWISFKQRFFTSVLVYKDGFENSNLEIKNPTDSSYLKHYHAQLYLPFTPGKDKIEMEFVFANNQFKVLQEQGYDLEKQIRLGWLFLKWINRIAVIPVFNLLDDMNLNYGVIILILTVLLKLVLSPLTYKSYLSMAKMRILKPEMDEIKEKVGADNPALLQQEYMKLYKQAGVNPLGGCVPLLLQLPITIAFFYFFPNLFELRGESFLWMHDLSTYDSLITFPKIPLLGWDHISLMCLLMTISTLIYTYFNNEISGATGEMKYLGYITPLIFLGVLNSYPSGLNFYYFCANMLTFAQQYFIKKFVDEDKIHAKIQENKKKKPSEKKTSSFQKRLEDYMRQKKMNK